MTGRRMSWLAGLLGFVGGLAIVAVAGVKSAEASAISSAVRAAASSTYDGCPNKQCNSCAFWTAHEISTSLGVGNQYFDMTCADVDCPNGCSKQSPNPEASEAKDLVSAEQVDQLWRAVANNDVPAVKVFLAEHRSATYNKARNSLQVVGCNQKTVISNIPLTQQQAEAITQ